MIPIFSSIPPTFSRKTPEGEECGTEYLRQCIESWTVSGFKPYSINSEREEFNPLARASGTTFLSVERDGTAIGQKPLVFLDDFLNAAQSVNSDVIAFTNADIFLDVSSHDLETIRTLRPGRCIFQKRRDVPRLPERPGQIQLYGYDFFVFHRDDLTGIPSSHFAIGLPWWDYYFLVMQMSKGLAHLRLKNSNCYHMLHAERWNRQNWLYFGRHYFELVSKHTPYESSGGLRFRTFQERLVRAYEGKDLSLKRRVEKFSRQATRNGRDMNLTDALNRVGTTSVSWVDSIAD